MTSRNVFKGFRMVPKQDGSGKSTIERIPQFGLDTSAKIRQRKSKKSRVVRPSQASMTLHRK